VLTGAVDDESLGAHEPSVPAGRDTPGCDPSPFRGPPGPGGGGGVPPRLSFDPWSETCAGHLSTGRSRSISGRSWSRASGR
jgi:hypothetical protein